jgi:hypothetical protein
MHQSPATANACRRRRLGLAGEPLDAFQQPAASHTQAKCHACVPDVGNLSVQPAHAHGDHQTCCSAAI